jgi:glycerol-3-phosphate cytidylyltransferase
MKNILVYGTFDLLHPGHIYLLEEAKKLGDRLIVGVSTDEFNSIKHKSSFLAYEDRKKMVEAIRYVDEVIPEKTWDQKIDDIKKYNIDTIVMGDDWKGSDKFEYLKEYCNVEFIPKMPELSSTRFRGFVTTYVQEIEGDVEDKEESRIKRVVERNEESN